MVDLRNIEGAPDNIRRWLIRNFSPITNGNDEGGRLAKSFQGKYSEVMENLGQDFHEAFDSVMDQYDFLSEGWETILGYMDQVDQIFQGKLNAEAWSRMAESLYKIPKTLTEILDKWQESQTKTVLTPKTLFYIGNV